MACPFCYCPFVKGETNLRLWKKIVDKLIELGCSMITFGGGDPFFHKGFSELLEYTYLKGKKKLFIHIDSNGLALKEHHYPILRKTVSLLGLPIEGGSAAIHDAIRNFNGHYQIIHKILRDTKEFSLPIKINKVVVNKNIEDLENIMKAISGYSIKTWSLYEFWPIGPLATKNLLNYFIDTKEFLIKTSEIKKACSFTKVEIGSVKSRHHSCFMVSDRGETYTVKYDDRFKYVKLGSIFQESVSTKWNEHGKSNELQIRMSGRY